MTRFFFSLFGLSIGKELLLDGFQGERSSSSTFKAMSTSPLMFVFYASNSCVDGNKIIFK